ncbi:B-type cyclin [Seminavis robusta]|uniref:B-type cyclin n=1 Tax=Seminavis robusta TaxID=568900 RepID=A0A9N8DSP7_9STRA|nr:B-type cyclin [Seminavis robusta]|eukprot:Sro251_g099220.1 B-type cyclin (776) ;mRNA; r:24402-26893
MPRTTRSNAAAAAALPTRKARPVFGDVSNNAKRGNPSKKKSSEEVEAANSRKRTASAPVEEVEATTNAGKRRSARLSHGAVQDDLPSSKPLKTAVASRKDVNDNVEKKATKGNKNESVNMPPRRTRSMKLSETTDDAGANESDNTQPSMANPDANEKQPARLTRAKSRGKAKDPPGGDLTAEASESAPDAPAKRGKARAKSAKPPAAAVENEPTTNASNAQLEVRATRQTRGRASVKPTESEPKDESKAPGKATKADRASTKDAESRGKAAVECEEKATTTRQTRAARGRAKSDDEPPPQQRRKTRSSSLARDNEQKPAAVAQPKEDQKMPARSTRARSRSKSAQAEPVPTRTTRRGSSRGARVKSSDAEVSNEAAASQLPTQASSRSNAAKATVQVCTKRPTRGKGNAKRARSSKRSRDGNDVSDEDNKPRKKSRTAKTAASSVPTQPSSPCVDFVRQDDFRLSRGDASNVRFDDSKFTLKVAPVDQVNVGNVLEAPEYVSDIMQRLFARELETRPHPYMGDQLQLNTSMRSILVDWLVEVHMKFRLEQTTLYLCVNVIDRYLELVQVERSQLQLVGVTALLIACKVEEIYPPEVSDCVYICDAAYTRDDVLETEVEIMKALEYKLSVPTGYPFLLRFLHITGATTLQGHAAQYYMERMLQEYSYLRHRPSLVAASAVSLALNNPSIRSYEGISTPAPGVPLVLQEYTGYEGQKIVEVAQKICHKVKNPHLTSSRRVLFSVKRKYEHVRYKCVSADFANPEINHVLDAYDQASS